MITNPGETPSRFPHVPVFWAPAPRLTSIPRPPLAAAVSATAHKNVASSEAARLRTKMWSHRRPRECAQKCGLIGDRATAHKNVVPIFSKKILNPTPGRKLSSDPTLPRKRRRVHPTPPRKPSNFFNWNPKPNAGP